MTAFPPYPPVSGKTYSLFNGSEGTGSYYEAVRIMTDKLVESSGSAEAALEALRIAGRSTIGRSLFHRNDPPPGARNMLDLMGTGLNKYLEGAEEHIKGRNPVSDCNSSIGTLPWQYPLYMVEIELTNRVNRKSFHQANYRFALLPHCLRDVWEQCKAQFAEYDEMCRHCNKDCYLNHVSRILEENNIQPLIWTTRDLKKMFSDIGKKHGAFAVLGIACIPELVAGMRRSMKHGVPTVGLPLNGNCCVRWFGEYRMSSVDLEELKRLAVGG